MFERYRACDLPGLARAWVGLRGSFSTICSFLFLNDVQYLICMVARVLGLVCFKPITPCEQQAPFHASSFFPEPEPNDERSALSARKRHALELRTSAYT